MNGYLNDPAATAACTTDDGFLTSGDVVVVDEEGFISIVDRKKDLIITGGANVYPREIEEVLATHEGVAECAVIGINDETWGERVVAVVVARAGKSLDHEIIEAHLRGKLAGYKMPKETVVIDALLGMQQERSSSAISRCTSPREHSGRIVDKNLCRILVYEIPPR